ncbi:MAG: histidine kinase [Pseudomonadota bacterium]
MNIRELLADRNRFYWALNLSGWAGYVVTAYIGAFAYDKPESYLWVISVSGLLGIAFTVPMRAIYRRWWSFPPVKLALSALALCFALASVRSLVINQLYFDWVKGGWTPSDWKSYFGGYLGTFYLFVCWSGLYFGIKYYQELQDQTRRALNATAAAHQAQLTMLRYQLNPHFLFNTLNAISTLILDHRTEMANECVTRLSDFLRYSLDNDPMRRVTLRQELEALDLYLEIEKVRFGERLTIQREVAGDALDGLVPSLILQPLIENAVKYAISPREEGGTIRIAARTHHQSLMVTIADDGPGLKNGSTASHGSTGVGLKNTRERLKQLYGDAQALTLAPNSPKGLVISINLPLEREASS